MTRAYRLVYAAACRRQVLRLPPVPKPLVERAIEPLAREPRIGKRLERELAGYLSLRQKRYRIIYRVNESARTVEIHYVGHRRDIYEVFSEEIRLRKSRLGACQGELSEI
jgi:mRNA-degrading endonuclease RelE of RelBE toxin-antitoxin system